MQCWRLPCLSLAASARQTRSLADHRSRRSFPRVPLDDISKSDLEQARWTTFLFGNERSADSSQNNQRAESFDRASTFPSLKLGCPIDLDQSTAADILMGNLPPALLVQVRLAFATCSRQYAVSRKSQFSTLRPLFRKGTQKPKTPKGVSIQVAHHRAELEKEKEKDRQARPSQLPHDTKELVAQTEGQTSVSTERQFQVPLKVIPKAQIGPNISLSPRERLQLEELTRRTPRPAPPPGN